MQMKILIKFIRLKVNNLENYQVKKKKKKIKTSMKNLLNQVCLKVRFKICPKAKLRNKNYHKSMETKETSKTPNNK